MIYFPLRVGRGVRPPGRTAVPRTERFSRKAEAIFSIAVLRGLLHHRFSPLRERYSSPALPPGREPNRGDGGFLRIVPAKFKQKRPRFRLQEIEKRGFNELFGERRCPLPAERSLFEDRL